MSTAIRIPKELQEFLNLPGPQTLLVRGPPGAGKTTLSLALLEAFKGSKILVTSRVPDRELGREFPWLGNNGGRSIQIIDTSDMQVTAHDISRTLRQRRETMLEVRGTEDRDAARFAWLPDPIQEAWSRLSEDRPCLVVIDSWDALVESYLGGEPSTREPVPDRGQIERLLIRQMAKAPAHLVFVLEREDQTALDYLVNGVVVTRRETSDQRLTRWMSLLKLRGVRIENPNYPFSLEGAKFEGILPLGPLHSLRPGAPDPETEPMPGFIWPGSADFASSFGRLAVGKITLLEVDEDASAEVPNLLCLPMVAHVLGLGGRVLLVPHTTETPYDIWEGLNGSVPRSRFTSHVRMIVRPGPVPKGKEEFWRIVLPVHRPEPGAPEQNPEDSEAMRFLMEGATERSPGLIVISLPGLVGVAQSMGLPLAPEGTGANPRRVPNSDQSGALSHDPRGTEGVPSPRHGPRGHVHSTGDEYPAGQGFRPRRGALDAEVCPYGRKQGSTVPTPAYRVDGRPFEDRLPGQVQGIGRGFRASRGPARSSRSGHGSAAIREAGACLSYPVPEVVSPEIYFLVEVSEGHRHQPLPLGAFEPPSQIFDSSVRERVQDSLEILSDSDIQDSFRVADQQAEMVTAGAFDTDHLPDERLAAVPLELEGGEVADRHPDEVLVGQPGSQMQPDLQPAMRAEPIAVEKKPSSVAELAVPRE